MNFVYQATAFGALMALDYRRQRDDRCDVLCCVKTGGGTKDLKSKPISFTNALKTFFSK